MASENKINAKDEPNQNLSKTKMEDGEQIMQKIQKW